MRPGQRREGAELFRDESGQLLEYARRQWIAVREGLFYLARVRQLGPEQAGRLTCEQFAHHEARGQRCERCGAVGVR